MTRDDEELDDKLVGSTVVGKYRVDRLIGRGGMGAVYEATNVAIGKRVALKFLDRDSSRHRDSVTRFQREAQAASAVESAHIVHIFDSGTSEEGRPFLVMELLTGEDLRALFRREGRLDVPQAVHIVGQALRALARAHEGGIVHRDLKPDNVFVCRRDDDPMFVKLVDFGISKIARGDSAADTLTRRGTVLGTAFYMSPEQAQAFPDIDGRADVFSAGAILFEGLAGRPPHMGSVYEAVLIEICTKDAPNIRDLVPSVPEELAKVIAKALARNRDERFQSANEMYDALALATPGLLSTGGRGATTAPLRLAAPASTEEKFATAGGTAVRPSSAGEARSQARRTLVAVVVTALGAFTLAVVLMANRPSQPSDVTSGARGGPADTPSAEPTASVTRVTDVPAPSPSASADAGRPPAPTARPVIGPRPPASAKPAASASGKATPAPTGVATGLQLDTRGP